LGIREACVHNQQRSANLDCIRDRSNSFVLTGNSNIAITLARQKDDRVM
jgi:hypothetical protein